MSENRLFSVVVPAAGVGSRMQASIPKQYLPLLDKTLIEQTLNALISHPRISHIYVALSDEDDYFDTLEVSNADWITRVTGGKERADSVLAGLNAAQKEDWILVHDAARPCISHRDIDKLIALAEKGNAGGILASPVRDTMKRAITLTPDKISHTEDRENLWHAYTPQFFPCEALRQALTDGLNQNVNITDEASAMEWAGHQVHLIQGSDKNIKVTRPEDLSLATYFLTQEIQK